MSETNQAVNAGASQWFYVSGSQRIGPLDAAVIEQLIGAGQITHDTAVWTEGMPDWVPARSVPSLAQPLSRLTPPTQPGFVGAPIRPADAGDNAGMRMLIPVGRSPWAIISGYLGLFSVLLIFAPFALITGIVAVRDIKKNPRSHGMGRAVFGIIMGGLGTGAGVLWIVIVALER